MNWEFRPGSTLVQPEAIKIPPSGLPSNFVAGIRRGHSSSPQILFVQIGNIVIG